MSNGTTSSPLTVTVQMTFDPNNTEHPDQSDSFFERDLESIMEYGATRGVVDWNYYQGETFESLETVFFAS